MNAITKRVTAMVVLASMLTAVPAWAEGACGSLLWIKSDATGGDWIAGLPDSTIDRTITTTTSTSGSGTVSGSGTISTAYPTGTSGSGTVSGSSTSGSTSSLATVEVHQVTYYQMNDGSRYELDCQTGAFKRVSEQDQP